MTRLRYNGLSTTLGGSLTSSATSVTFGAALTYNGGTAVPTISSPDYIPLSILDTNGVLAEVVYLTAYTTGGTTGTITRAREGTAGASRASGLKVAHGPTALDMPLAGSLVTSCISTTSQSISANGSATVLFASEATDPLGLHSTSSNTDRFTIPSGMDGDYLVIGQLNLSYTGGPAGSMSGAFLAQILKNGTEQVSRLEAFSSNYYRTQVTAMLPLVAGDYVTLGFTSGAALTINGGVMTIRPLGLIGLT